MPSQRALRIGRGLLFFCVAISSFIASGCQKASPEDPNPVELRTYEVPTGSVGPLMNTIKDAFWVGENQKPLGRPAMTPGGRLAVVAPRNVQDGVQRLVDEVTKHPPSFEPTIELRYWLILGKPAASPQPPPQGVSEIEPALDEIARATGPQRPADDEKGRVSPHGSTARGPCAFASEDAQRAPQRTPRTSLRVASRCPCGSRRRGARGGLRASSRA
jgi:hypothetical protein